MSRIYLEGDSITYGYWDCGADGQGGWGNRLKMNLMERGDYKHEVFNLAAGNQTLQDIINRLPSQISSYGRARSLGVFMLGGADSVIRPRQKEPQLPLSEFKFCLPALAKVLRDHRITPMFVGPYELDESKTNPTIFDDRFTNERTMEYAEVLHDFAAEVGGTWVDLKRMSDYSPAETMSPDAIHPNSFGHLLIAQDVTEAVVQRLEAPLLTYNS